MHLQEGLGTGREKTGAVNLLPGQAKAPAAPSVPSALLLCQEWVPGSPQGVFHWQTPHRQTEHPPPPGARRVSPDGQTIRPGPFGRPERAQA